MGKLYDWTIISIFASLQWSVNILPSSAYFQATVDGYLFTIPGFNDQEKRTQTNAQTWCTGNQSKLLEITTDSIQRSVVTFINNARSQNQMTGNNVITNGKRFTSTFSWVNGNAVSSGTYVMGQEPGFAHSYGYLNSSQSRFEFIADTPTAKRGYICEGSSFCSNGFTLNGRCFKSNSEALSWFDARNRCMGGGGGDLASFDFILDNKGFSALNGSGLNPPSTYWIGLLRLKWTWQGSNSNLRYSRWADGHPGYTTNFYTDCLCLQADLPIYDWQWIECNCSQTNQFVCMTESTRTPTSNNPVSTETVNSPFISATAVSNLSPKSTSVSAGLNITALAVGLGVGLGLGILMTMIILILASMIVRLKRKLKSSEMNRNIPLDGAQKTTNEGIAATTYESLKADGQRTDVLTYEEINTRENRQKVKSEF